MKKIVLFTMLFSSVGFFACQDDKDPGNNGGLVDVVVTSNNNSSDAAGARTEVTSRGVTNWSVGDMVTLIDVDRSLRDFLYAEETAKTSATFTGKLLAGRGVQTYYAYYAPEATNCFPENNDCLSFDRQDLDIMVNGELNGKSKLLGSHCPMVAIPAKFDAENIDKNMKFQFYHVNSLINATIASKPSDGRLKNLVFDKAIFTVNGSEIGSGDPAFNTVIHVSLSGIESNPVSIPYMEVGQKIHTMSSTLRYTNPKTIEDLYEGVTGYGIPIFALPTTTDFACDAKVELYSKDVLVCRLERGGNMAGLNLAGLNIINFTEDHITYF